LLTDEGHHVDTLDNAADALKTIKDGRYSLILLDIKMPGMSGIELYRRLQKMAGSLEQRVVFVTGDVRGTETMKFISRTKAPYITKPFDIPKLKKELNRLLAEIPSL
jgi:CheY-like chemotaxis protein